MKIPGYIKGIAVGIDIPIKRAKAKPDDLELAGSHS